MSPPSFMDRATQRQALRILADVYPNSIQTQRELAHLPVDNIHALLGYLEQHRLVDCEWFASFKDRRVQSARITALGLDFLADDGGLGAILGVVTVKLHEDTIKALFAERIDASDIPQEQKSALKKRLETMGSEALKVATQEAIKAGLSKMPDVIRWIQGVLSA